MPEYGTHVDVCASYLEMYAVKTLYHMLAAENDLLTLLRSGH